LETHDLQPWVVRGFEHEDDLSPPPEVVKHKFVSLIGLNFVALKYFLFKGAVNKMIFRKKGISSAETQLMLSFIGLRV